MQGKPIALIYIGNGTYIHGVPARDLSPEEANQYQAIIDEQQRLTGTVLYQAPPKEVANG
jgi:hypothetical protein